MSKYILLLGIILIFMANVAEADDWPMFMHDAQHTGKSEDIVEPPLELLWDFTISNAIIGYPVIFNNTIFFQEDGNQDGIYLYALDTKKGTLKWKYEIGPHDSYYSPAVNENGVYTLSTFNNEPTIVSIDINDGTLKWRKPIGLKSSPIIVNNTLFFIGWSKGIIKLFALDAVTGNIKGECNPPSRPISSPVYYEGKIFRDFNDFIDIINDVPDCKYTDTDFLNVAVPNFMAISDGFLYKSFFINPGYSLSGSDLKGISKGWSYHTTKEYINGAAAFSNNTMVLNMGTLNAYNSKNGTLLWTVHTGQSFESSPIISGNTVYVSGSEENKRLLYAFNLIDGKELWRTNLITSNVGAISDGILFTPSVKKLYAFTTPDLIKSNKSITEIKEPTATRPPFNIEPIQTQKDPIGNDSVVGLLVIIIVGVILYFINYLKKSEIITTKSDQKSTIIRNKDLERKQLHETSCRSFEEGFNYSQEASSFFAKKNFKRALESYNKALNKFESTQNTPNIDTSLSTSIKNNKMSVQSNIVSCKLALGSSASELGTSNLEKEDLNNAIKSYNNARNYFEEALQDASAIKDEEKQKNAKELLSQTITNIENCHINIDRRQVEALSKSAKLMLKEAEEHRNRKELSKAREILKNAENSIEDAFDIATMRGFNDAQRILSTLLKNVRAEKNVVDSLFMTPIEKIKTGLRVSDVLALEPEIKVAKNINDLQVLREFEYFGGCIRVKISVKNTSSLLIGEAALELESDDNILHYDRCEPEYPEKKGKILLGNLDPNTDRTISLYLDPLICAKEGTNVNCRIFYKDAHGKSDMVQMPPLKIKMVCPIFFTEQEINIGRLKELIAELRSRDSKVYMFPKKVELQEILRSCSDVIQLHDVRHIKTFKTTDEKTYESWYYGKTKVSKKDLVMKCAIRRDTESIEIFVSGNDPKDITGLLAEIGRNLTKEFEKLGKVQPVFNVVVKNSMLKGSNLLSFCDLNGICGGNVVIEDSFVEGTNVASWNREDKEKAQDALRETEQQVRQMEKVAHIQEEKEYKPVRIEQGGKSSGGKWFFGVILIFGVLALGWYGMQGSNSPQASVNPVPTANPAVTAIQKNTPSVIAVPVLTAKATPSTVAIVTSSADQKTITNSIGMEFVQIPAGEFDMGSPSNEKDRSREEGPVHRVKISNALYIGKYEVTQKQWRDVMGTSPSNFIGADLPVEQVSWNDAQDFIKKLNAKESGNIYRLPSEAEWEYAARAGTTTRYSFGDDESRLGDYAWYSLNSVSKTHSVGQKKPNPWGLFDMHGNVWEWVQDKYQSSYSGVPTDGSAWEGDSSFRIIRGGCWGNYVGCCRSAVRAYAEFGANFLGFRLVRIS